MTLETDMLSVANKPIVLRVIMLNVVAPSYFVDQMLELELTNKPLIIS
jgi:hypothetical protein